MTFFQNLFGPLSFESLEAKKDIKGFIKALGYDKSREACLGTARMLGKIGDTRAVKLVIAAFKDKNSSLRRAAALALGRLGDPWVVEPLENSNAGLS